MTNILLLKFIAPLQAYGASKMQYYGYKNTQNHPTKSAVIGILASALGYSRGDERIDVLNERIKVSTRIDQQGTLLEDYQTTKSGSGKASESYISHKQYLQDAIFLVALESDDISVLCEIQKAIKNPRWGLTLGKRNCIPSEPLLESDILQNTNAREVFKRYKWLAKAWYRKLYQITSLECYFEDEAGQLTQDVYSTKNRKFMYRFEKMRKVSLKEFEKNMTLVETIFEEL